MLAAAAIVAAAACSDSTSPSGTHRIAHAAFLSTPAGFSSTDNSFSAGGDAGEPWMPDRNARDGGGMMGGGCARSSSAAFGSAAAGIAAPSAGMTSYRTARSRAAPGA